MRLHRLRLQAFGPFAGTEEVDFDDLAAGGLHLIHGPTGAGKSSILDAICFALFSGVPGSRMQGRNTLHSDHAAPTIRPEVELEFTVGDRRLRVQRSPEHQVAKKRGTGTRTQRGAVHLEELRAGRWATVSTRADEVGQVIGDLLGMGLQQFAQVMLLPQGEFTAFLRAKPDDRGKLLERLFDISDFAAVEQWLVEHRRTLEARTVRADAQRAALIARAQEALSAIPTGDDEEGTALPDLDGEGAVGALRTLCEHLSERLTAAMADADAATAHAERVRTRLADERALAGLQGQAHSAQQVLDRLEAQAPVIADAEAQLERARRADSCRPAIAALQRRQAALQSAAEATRDARSTLAAASRWPVPEQHGADALTEASLQPLHERAMAGSAALAGQPELSRQLDTIQTQLRAATVQHDGARDNATRCDAAVADAAERLSDLTARLDGCRPRAATDPQWRSLLSWLDAAVGAAGAAIADLQHAVEVGDQRRAAHREWATVEQEAIRLRQTRLLGIAAELAAGLQQGEPCPVCGAVEHPQPAQTTPDHVDAEQVAAAEDIAAEALARSEHAGSQWSAAVGRAERSCGLLLDSLEPGPDVEHPDTHDTQLDAALAELRGAVAAALPEVIQLRDTLAAGPRGSGPGAVQLLHGLHTTLGSVRATVATGAAQAAAAAAEVCALEAQLETLRATKLTAEQTAAAVAESARRLQERVDSLRSQLAAARGRLDELAHEHDAVCGCSSEADQGAAHTRCVQQLTALTTAAHAQRVAATEVRRAHDELAAALHEHRFEDTAAALSSVLTDADHQRLRALVDDAHTERAKATGVLEQPEVAAALAGSPADVDGVSAELSVAERSARHTQEVMGDVRRALHSVERITDDLRAHDERSGPLHEQLAVATSLSTAVTGSGDNVMRMRLTAYVLAARLETVTDLANERLQVMSAGRYQLEHTDEKAGRGTKSGLGLRVRDAWTGTTRDTSSLSGGESFIASLALALGLGDAVLQAAGGRRLETLLVDEGFGSLDEESLDQVLDVLDALRAGGRSIGIVSHVAELRARIPAQIRVHKTVRGSTLQVVTTGAA